MLVANLQELFFPPSLFAQPAHDVERAKLLYLAQFMHRGCGGAPVAFDRNGQIACSGCLQTWPVKKNIGETLRANSGFRCMVLR